jgi:hypothetical protein
MRLMLVMLILIFVVAFGYTEASRLANQSRALLTGVAIGVIASVPASLLAALLAARSAGNRDVRRVAPPEPEPRRAPAPPPVVIVGSAHQARSSRYVQYTEPPPEPRHFTILGDDDNT